MGKVSLLTALAFVSSLAFYFPKTLPFHEKVPYRLDSGSHGTIESVPVQTSLHGACSTWTQQCDSVESVPHSDSSVALWRVLHMQRETLLWRMFHMETVMLLSGECTTLSNARIEHMHKRTKH